MNKDDVVKALITDPVMQQRLAKHLVLNCFRNSVLEDLHAGTVPASKTGDYSDVIVHTPFGQIPWNELSPPLPEMPRSRSWEGFGWLGKDRNGKQGHGGFVSRWSCSLRVVNAVIQSLDSSARRNFGCLDPLSIAVSDFCISLLLRHSDQRVRLTSVPT